MPGTGPNSINGNSISMCVLIYYWLKQAKSWIKNYNFIIFYFNMSQFFNRARKLSFNLFFDFSPFNLVAYVSSPDLLSQTNLHLKLIQFNCRIYYNVLYLYRMISTYLLYKWKPTAKFVWFLNFPLYIMYFIFTDVKIDLIIFLGIQTTPGAMV